MMKNPHSVQIQAFESNDLAAVKALLCECRLPYEDIDDHVRHFLVLKTLEQEIIGVVGFERYDKIGLLRSLAVKQAHRQCGWGDQLCTAIEQSATTNGIDTLYLLTTTAESFFQKRSYQRIDRQLVTPPITQTREFSNLCPQSAAVMSKLL